jgi:hypothetical protein
MVHLERTAWEDEAEETPEKSRESDDGDDDHWWDS